MDCPKCGLSEFDVTTETQPSGDILAKLVECNGCGWTGRDIPIDDLIDDANSPDVPDAPWLHLLEPQSLRWREAEILRGRNPDPHIEAELIKNGLWPPK